MSFDLQEALNGAPVKLNNGRKAFMLYDLRKYPSLLRATGRLPINGIMLGNNEDDSDHVTWDEFGKAENSYLSISGMWEEPELTPEQVLEKAYQDDLLVLCDGNPDLPLKVIAKAKNGEFVVQPEDTTIQPWLANLTMEWFFVKDPAPKSDTITVTLPKPFKPKEGEVYYSIGGYHNGMIAEMRAICMTDISILSGNCFHAESDAQAWLDAMANALDD